MSRLSCSVVILCCFAGTASAQQKQIVPPPAPMSDDYVEPLKSVQPPSQVNEKLVPSLQAPKFEPVQPQATPSQTLPVPTEQPRSTPAESAPPVPSYQQPVPAQAVPSATEWPQAPYTSPSVPSQWNSSGVGAAPQFSTGQAVEMQPGMTYGMGAPYVQQPVNAFAPPVTYPRVPNGYLGPAPIGGIHPRYPYYSYRRPWYPPGPASANVTIIW